MTRKAKDRDPSEFGNEPYLRNDAFLPHLLTVATNGYAWSASRLYLDVLGLGVNEVRILAILHEFGMLRAWEICDILDMNKATVSQGLKKLQNKNLVEIHRKRDGRFAKPTPESEPVHRQIVRMARAREEILLEGFSETERDNFFEYLRRFRANLEDSIDYAERHFLKGASDPDGEEGLVEEEATDGK